MDTENTACKIEGFLRQQFPLIRNVDRNGPLLNSGLIDSLGILEVVTFVEKEFGIVVSDDDLLPENFGSIENLTRYVVSKNPSSNI
jgi:acyl carrier protein